MANCTRRPGNIQCFCRIGIMRRNSSVTTNESSPPEFAFQACHRDVAVRYGHSTAIGSREFCASETDVVHFAIGVSNSDAITKLVRPVDENDEST